MNDQAIIDLYWKRSERAIEATAQKYGGYCYTIAYNILNSREDADECVNDTYMKVWQAIPPTRPARLIAYLAKLVRNVSLHQYEKANAKKRGAGQVPLIVSELEHCLAASDATDSEVVEVLNDFLAQLPRETRQIFMGRYFHFQSIKDIATMRQVSESKVKMVLLRTRNDLKQVLEAEGVAL
ncbi:MAG: sigma-70 family RNA polymerase sigma factor [Exiguobacterium sp.]|nr:sigma-70 family RNA polymerase sigma factor [Exiguobacterium sp.]MDX5426172.1 sigma-70 family RNA polymerase sigma factor [Exiguobacterium sp.]MDX6773545.1 sigma-70 family RNA polymerase sigma factor [Exiguobacterium sp.]